MYGYPQTATVNSDGQAVITISQSVTANVWKVTQVTFGLGLLVASPQVAVTWNGIPLAASPVMQPNVFADLPSSAPYAMSAEMQGPPYIVLQAGDQLACGVLGATPGDTFTVTALYDLYTSSEQVYMT